MVMEKEANLTIGFVTTTAKRNWFMTASYVYYTSSLMWVVPPGREMTSLQKLYQPFQLTVWLCFGFALGISFLLVEIIRNFFSKCVQDFVFGKGVKYPSLNIINITFGGSLHKLPSRNFARTILTFYMICPFLIQNSYKGGLFQYLQKPLFEDGVKSLNEMIDNDFHFYLLKSSRELFSGMPRVLNRGTFMNPVDFYAMFNKLLDPEFKGALMSTKDHIAYRNIISAPDKFFRIAPEIISTYSIVIYMHKQTCLARQIDHKIIDLVTGGFIDLWASTFTDKKYLKRKSKSRANALTFEQLSGAFQLLITGLIICVIIFLCELMIMRVKCGIFKKSSL